MIRPHDAWVLRRLVCVCDHGLNGELQTVSEPFRRLADHLAALPVEDRQKALDGFLCGRDDRDQIIMDLADIDPEGPPPEAENDPARFATVADLRRVQTETRWVWEGWIPSSRIVGIAAFEGTGKTRFALDLCRRAYLGLTWPDGQNPTLPIGIRSIWMCSDAHQDELADILPTFGIPDDAIVFPTPSEEPYGGTDLDIPETLAALEEAIIATKPAFVFIDTLTSATSRDLCDQRTIKPLKAALAPLTQTHQINIMLQLHLNREGQALGRRIRGLTRTLIHLECPDSERPERLRLWVEKSYAKKPPALGVTMRDGGNDYDFDPPVKPEKAQGGRPREKRDKARKFIIDALTRENDRKAAALCAEYVQSGGTESTFWNARDDMVEAGELTCDGKPKIMHLIRLAADDDQSY
jgi:hypothetical protein